MGVDIMVLDLIVIWLVALVIYDIWQNNNTKVK